MKKPSKSISEYDPSTWLIEEYKLLSSHYFHEDNQLEKVTALFATLNGILLTFIGSNFSANNKITLILIPIVGIVFSVFWFLIHNRVRVCRNYNENRILEIENMLHKCWGDLDILPLDIRVLRNFGKKNGKKNGNKLTQAINKIPSSYLEMILPFTFLIVWIFILYNNDGLILTLKSTGS